MLIQKVKNNKRKQCESSIGFTFNLNEISIPVLLAEHLTP